MILNRGTNRVDITSPGVIDIGNYGYADPETEPCKWVVLCWERHLKDLSRTTNPKKFPYYFDEQAALRAITFFDILKQSKGEWAGKPFKLMLWQKMIIWIVYGWMREDDTRRFRVAWCEIPRKGGKSTFSAGHALILTFADGEPGAEVYCVAALCLDTKIPTTTGWKTVGELRVNDTVFDENGAKCSVTYLTEVFTDHDTYEVVFDDGSRVVADAGHRWFTERRRHSNGNSGSTRIPKLRCEDGRKAVFSLHNKTIYVCRWSDPDRDSKFEIALRNALECEPLRDSTFGVRTTVEILETLIQNGSPNHSIDLCGALQLPETTLPIPPYTLGAWLGDGRSNRGAFKFHPQDVGIETRIVNDGFLSSRHKENTGLLAFTALGLRTLLRGQGLIDNKHIPSCYFTAGIEQRRELVRGLMDTDGTITKTGECRFVNTNKGIAEGCHELLLSLGFKSHLREVSQNVFCVSFRNYADQESVFTLERKSSRRVSKKSHGKKALRRYIVEVNKISSRPVKCIEVDSPSHQFLCGENLIATHNTKRDQARIVFSEAQRMVKQSAELRQYVDVLRSNINCVRLASKLEPLSSDSGTADGLNVHGAILDEIHAMKGESFRLLHDLILTARGARRNPLVFYITTAGIHRESIAHDLHRKAKQVLEGVIDDETFFAYIATVNEGQDWKSEEAWKTANPSYGITLKKDNFLEECQAAIQMPNAQNTFLRLRLNVWTDSVTAWMTADQWKACEDKELKYEDLKGFSCYAGLDLSSTIDITALVLAFPIIDTDLETGETVISEVIVMPHFFVPEENARDREIRDGVPYTAWIRDGEMEATPGSAVDYSFIRKKINELNEIYSIEEIAIDRWNAAQLAQELDGEGYTVIPFGQGYKSMSDPCKQLQTLVLSKKLKHDGNQPLRWMCSNAVIEEDAAGNIKLSKKKSTEKIDGMVATTMAVGRALLQEKEEPTVYQDRGLITI